MTTTLPVLAPHLERITVTLTRTPRRRQLEEVAQSAAAADRSPRVTMLRQVEEMALKHRALWLVVARGQGRRLLGAGCFGPTADGYLEVAALASLGTVPGTGRAMMAALAQHALTSGRALLVRPVFGSEGFYSKLGARRLPRPDVPPFMVMSGAALSGLAEQAGTLER